MSETTATRIATYKEYADHEVQWLGHLPSHWKARRLGSIAEMRISNVDKHSKEEELPVRLCNYVDVYKNDHISRDMPFMRATASTEEINRFQLHKHDVLITKDSETWDDIAVPALVTEPADDLISGYHLALLRPNGDILGPYLFRTLQSRGVAHQFHIAANGVTRYGLTHNGIQSVVLPVPPHDEQAAIVRYLNDADQRIRAYVSAKERLIALLEEERQAVIHQAVTKGLDLNVKLKPSGVEWLGDVPEHWEVRKLKHACSQKAQYGANIPASEYTTSGIRFLRTTDITADGAVVGEGVYIPRDLSPECLLNPGDILLTRSGATIGQSFLYDMNEHGECSFAGYLVRFSPSPEMLPKFVYLFTTSPGFQNPVQQSAIVSTIENVNAEKYANIQMPVPPLHEQTIIVRHLDELTKRVDLAIDLARRQIELIEEYRTRLIADVVTGKMDVR